MNENRAQWICSALDVEGGERVVAEAPTKPTRKGLAAAKKLWKKDTVLKVRFLQGEKELHDRVLNAARSWFINGVRLKLETSQPGEVTHIRVGFDAGDGSWSYIGTDSLAIHPSQPTMNLGWATLETPERDFLSVVIHEFGHALGLLHEHNHPDARIQWNKPAVYADLQGHPNYWSRQTIDNNVFAKYDASSVITTDFDNASVMIYPISPNWTVDGKSCKPSWKLSKGDTATILKLYG